MAVIALNKSNLYPALVLINNNQIAIIEEEPNVEIDLSDELIESSSSSFSFKCKELSKYNKSSIRKEVNSITDVTQASSESLSSIKSREDNIMFDFENAPHDDESTGRQKVLMTPSLVSVEYRMNQEDENVIETPRHKRQFHHNFFPNNTKTARSREKNLEIKECVQSFTKSKVRKTIGALAVGDKEGYLEKQSNGLFTKWKRKYCRFHDDILTFYADVSTGRVSGCIDLKRVPVTLGMNKSRLCFLYVLFYNVKDYCLLENW